MRGETGLLVTATGLPGATCHAEGGEMSDIAGGEAGPAAVPGDSASLARVTALRFVLLLGFVSLFADATYEGARSITGPYLAVLGASAAAVGVVAGFGELAGYALRLASGFISDRTQRYWAMTFLGYATNVLAVPALALAGRWEVAGLLIIAERTGKGLRTPPRDAMLSHATGRIGHGWGFGLHEALDQVGAVIGPLIVASVLAVDGSYRMGFAVLLIPASLALATLAAARLLYPRPHDLEIESAAIRGAGFPGAFWLYLMAAAVVAAGYADFPLIAFHLERENVVAPALTPVFYATAMGFDALSALVFGRLFDRFGVRVLAVASLLASPFAPLVFWGDAGVAFLGVSLWGIGLGAQESVMRAAVAPMVAADRRGTAYGVFNTGYGLSWFAGSALIGVLYDASLPALVGFASAMQLVSIPMFLMVGRAQSLQGRPPRSGQDT
jgi:MFS family permease